ncbi:peptide chain release factor N(5)-glutamine methyltransferase [Hydrogenoanaerobacterium sp.]|uniref:peptide chain release factor N(5)-glutamine methyltransferase n=1 Tax=Hydrogenoanaerobacterium sp. TaxID=2953763 RepID=UPI00289D772F|nr:peptide chain release factor N(5)-glutamine methyltransferase [Hydrogenoanaerobacterium sp.]
MVELHRLRVKWMGELEKAGVYAPAFELCEIIEHATGLDRAHQLAFDAALTHAQITAVEALLAIRCTGKPLQYILGKWEFYGLDFYVGEGVLIPRADTETLVEFGLEQLKGIAAPRVADLCSGSGCIAIALAKNLPASQVTAAELSDAAYGYLTRNIALNEAGNVAPLKMDVLAEGSPRMLEASGGGAGIACFDLIVSNPPYVRTAELQGLQREVQYEPMMALDGTASGLYFYREITRLYKNSLKKGGWLAYEVGDDQSHDVQKILQQNGFANIATKKDLGDFERVVAGMRP